MLINLTQQFVPEAHKVLKKKITYLPLPKMLRILEMLKMLEIIEKLVC